MKPTLYVEDIFNHKHEENSVITLSGWVYSKRNNGKIKFINLRDGTGTIQVVLIRDESEQKHLDEFSKLNQESSLTVTGKLVKSEQAPGGYELLCHSLEEISESKNYPITPKEHGPAFLLDRRHLWLRSKRQNAILRIRSEVIFAAHEFFHKNGFIAFDAPIFTPNACEGTTDLFEVNYFDEDKAYLSQSGQLYGEAGATAFGKVYVFGPTFRAEKSKTRRHLTEFWMLEPEVAFMDLNGAMELAEEMMEYIVSRVMQNKERELQALDRDLDQLKKIKGPFPRLHYSEAAAILEKESQDQFKTGGDFGGGDETILASKFDKPVFIHRFPSAIKAFYMKEDPENPEFSLSVDLVAPEGYGEIIGGGQREEDIKVLQQKLKNHPDIDPKVFEWYFDLRRFGSVPHSGFGLGIERCVAWICGTKHVRECIPFPRMLSRLRP